MITRLAPAKLNLFLHILNRDINGYHCIQTLFQLIDYCDELQFRLRNDGVINCHCIPVTPFCDLSSLHTDNIIITAAKLLQTRMKISLGVEICVKKRIPLGAGLGGGSSNAATTLRALNTLWKLHLPDAELLNLATQLGADVPVFFQACTAWAEGYGEQLQTVQLPRAWFVVLVPPVTVATQKIFSHPELTRNTTAITIAAFFSGSVKVRNDCEPLVRRIYPIVDEAFHWFEHYVPTRLTGTGACLFAQFKSKKEANIMLKRFIASPYRGFLAKGLNCAPQ